MQADLELRGPHFHHSKDWLALHSVLALNPAATPVLRWVEASYLSLSLSFSCLLCHPSHLQASKS